ncbi:hypothetical protein [Novispirillum itersonii]|uniref:Uncharacterized protein n=1 Tax=Novispirillum itersonii TaxID=189 RepID=A0A7W9ZH22_NOVIT|nr:hypothetical protein [Novispirillum itersonii]MBB6211356.1 hypothetical protein [Novispirillum itersonii]
MGLSRCRSPQGPRSIDGCASAVTGVSGNKKGRMVADGVSAADLQDLIGDTDTVSLIMKFSQLCVGASRGGHCFALLYFMEWKHAAISTKRSRYKIKRFQFSCNQYRCLLKTESYRPCTENKRRCTINRQNKPSSPGFPHHAGGKQDKKLWFFIPLTGQKPTVALLTASAQAGKVRRQARL